MKTCLFTTVLFCLTTMLFSQKLPEKAPADPDFSISAEELEEMKRNGITLPPVKPAHEPWANIATSPRNDFPIVYDMRETPWLTSVKSQSAGGCWAYSVMGAVESRWLMLGLGEFDLSDNNLKYCHKYLPERSTNGNHWMATSYFARRSGPYSESDDPHPGGTSGPEDCPNDLTPLYYIHHSRYTPPMDMDFTKQTVLDWGPVWSLMYYNANYFNTNDNTYFYGGSHSVNHAGIVVGWNDTLQTAGGTGAWIVKNTYGPNWGDAGYYYISYNDAQFLKYNGYWPDVMEHETDVHLYQYDEIGGYWGVGFGNETGYGLVKYEGVEGITEITKIGTFVLYAGSGVEIKIYQQFDGELSGLLASMEEVTCELPGYYTFDLDSTVIIQEGTDFYVQIKYDSRNPDNQWPIAIEDTIPTYSKPHIETGKFWVAPNPELWPAAWYPVGHGTNSHYDLCIKAYASKLPPVPAPVAYAGQDTAVAEDQQFAISGAVAENFNAISWSGSGDGTFSDTGIIDPVYTPGLNDISAGSVTLTLTVYPNPPLVAPATDEMKLTIHRYPSVEILTPAHLEKICDSEIIISGTATDPDENLEKIEISLNNAGWQIADGSSSWSYVVQLTPGINSISTRAVDGTGLVSEISMIEVVYSVQTISLSAGWSAVSSFLLPDITDVELLLQDVAENLVVITGMGGIYAPPPINTNTLGNWNTYAGYKVKMLTDDHLTYCGDLPESNAVSFSEGFHIVPVLTNVACALDEVFDDPEDDILYLFDLYHEQIYWPAGEIFSLTALYPGIGYQGHFLNPVTLNYPPHEGFFAPPEKATRFVAEDAPWRFTRSGSYHLFSINQKALQDFGAGFIGAFDKQDNCIGLQQLSDQMDENLLLVAYGSEETSGNNSFTNGGEISFKFYDLQSNEAYQLDAVYDVSMPQKDGNFLGGGMSGIKAFQRTASIMNQNADPFLTEVFPNPADDAVIVSYPAIRNQPLIKLMTIDGKLVKAIHGNYNSTDISVSEMNPGIYFIKVEVNEGTFYQKLVVK
jgi:C1A family cysteine protease